MNKNINYDNLARYCNVTIIIIKITNHTIYLYTFPYCIRGTVTQPRRELTVLKIILFITFLSLPRIRR